jgi:hypothetical protein
VRKVWLSIALHTTPRSRVPRPGDRSVTAGVETDVLASAATTCTEEARNAVTVAHPRPDFKRRIRPAFTDGNRHRPRSTFGNVNADVLAHYDPDFVRDDFVEIILKNGWPE